MIYGLLLKVHIVCVFLGMDDSCVICEENDANNTAVKYT